MPQKKTLPNEPYDFAVEAVFHMSDGSVFFVGLPDKVVGHMSPAMAQIIKDSHVVGTLKIDTERMPSPLPNRRYTLVSNEPFNHKDLGENFTLRCAPLAETTP